jgi:hypothetical protein
MGTTFTIGGLATVRAVTQVSPEQAVKVKLKRPARPVSGCRKPIGHKQVTNPAEKGSATPIHASFQIMMDDSAINLTTFNGTEIQDTIIRDNRTARKYRSACHCHDKQHYSGYPLDDLSKNH